MDPFDFNLFMLCPWTMSFFQKLCPAPFPPVSCSFPEARPGSQCCVYNLLEEQPENSWPTGRKCCIISNPSRYSGLHLPCFPQHVQHQHLPGDSLGRATGTQCLSIGWRPFKGNWASRDNVCHFGSYPCRPFGPKPLSPFS